MRECFFGIAFGARRRTTTCSACCRSIIYSLLIVISIKYIAIVMRADNQGEGGILALTALLPQRNGKRGPGRRWC